MDQNSIFEQATQITKAHGYDILSEQVKEFKSENDRLRSRVKYLEGLIKEYSNKMLATLSNISDQ